MFKWYLRYKGNKAYKEWKRGYDWAAGEILRNTKTFTEIDAYTYGKCEPFDFGADAACEKLKDLYKQIHFKN